MKLSFALKIGGSFGLILVILLLIGLISLKNLIRLQESAVLVEYTEEIETKMEEVSNLIKDAETAERGYIITGEEDYLEPYTYAIGEIPGNMTELGQMFSDPDQQNRFQKYESMIDEKIDFVRQAISTRRDEGFDAARDLIITDIGQNFMSGINDLHLEMTDIENQIQQEQQTEANQNAKNAKLTIILLTAVSILIVVFLIIFLTYNIALPIRNISGIAERISMGDLRFEISNTDRKDEVGVLMKAFSCMVLYLKEMTQTAIRISERNLDIEIKPVSEQDGFGTAFNSMKENLKAQVTEITETVNVLTAMVAEIITTSSQLTASSSETVSAISETTTTVEEVKQTAQVNNEKAKAVSDNSQKTLQVARDGEKAVNETGSGMTLIREKMEFIAESIMRLSEQSQAIGDIMNSINDLAEQSNLLAVNASIEAAKAGEEGKGFAVVADEVKSLADQSKQATKQVREILTDIQKATSTAVLATEEGSKVVESGIKQADNAGASIKVLAEVINEAAQATTQIGISVQQQFVGIDQVTEAIRSISVASNQNLESTKQLEEASEKLDGVAKSLEKLVEAYTI